MTFQSSASDLLIVNRYLVATTATEGRYTSIQAAINRAVADGASTANPMNIIIKEGVYAENITIYDGITLIGMESSYSRESTPDLNVRLNGTVTFTTGIAQLNRIGFVLTTGDIINMSGGELYLIECEAQHSSGQFFVFTTATNKTVLIDRCTLSGTGTASLISHDGTAAVITIRSTKSFYGYIGAAVTTIIGASGTYQIKHTLDSIQLSWDFQCPTMNLNCLFCEILTVTGNDLITTAVGTTTGAIDLQNCAIYTGANDILNIGNAAVTHSIVNTNIDSADWIRTLPASTVFHTSNFIGGTLTDTRLILNNARTGFRASEYNWQMGQIQTLDAVATTIWTYTLGANQGVTARAQVSGKIDDSSAYCGGDIVGCARRAGAGAALVGATVANVIEDSGGAPTFDIVVVGNDILLQVTGIAAETWNWACTVTYQRIELNT